MSRFLDLEAELDSDNEHLDDDHDDDGEQSVVQEDLDFIDDSVQDADPPTFRLHIPEEPSDWDQSRWNRQQQHRDHQQQQLHDFGDEAPEEPHPIVHILREADAEDAFMEPVAPRAAIRPDAIERYAHFQRPAPVLDSVSSSLTETTVSPPPPKSALANLSVSSAPFGTFAPKKSRSDMEDWRRWATHSRREAPNERVRRRELAPGEWVKVLQGFYKQDVGMVWKPGKTATGQTGYFLLLVPRLSGSKKRKRERPLPGPFRPEDFKEAERGEDASTFRFQGKTFSHGLLIKFFDEMTVERAHVLTPEARQHFSSCEHPFVKRFPFPLPEFFVFEVGDKVQAKGRKGIVTHVGDSLCEVNFGADGEHSYPAHLLEKDITPGDSVKVLAGVHSGREGMVAERHGAILYVSVRHSNTGIDFFVHVNSVKLQQESFDTTPADDVPWVNLEVVVTRGRYKEMRGLVKAVRLTPRRDRLVLLVYVPVFACSAELDHDHVVEQTTTKKLLDFCPLSATQSKFSIDPVMVQMRSGRVPWIGMRVRIIAGAHKGKEGVVRDVNRPLRGFEESGLAVAVELQIISPNMSNRIEMIDYARVCEFDSRLELAKVIPLTREQDFYVPWVGKEKRVGGLPTPIRTVPATENPHLLSSSRTPQYTSEYKDIDPDDLHNPWNPYSISPSRTIPASKSPSSQNPHDASEYEAMAWNDPRNFWNPHSLWSAPDFLSPPASPLGPVTSLNADPRSIPETPASPNPHRSDKPDPPAALAHPLLHANLLGISIRVAIISGRWKRKTAFVTPTSSEDGPFFAFRLGGETHRIDHRCIGKHPELPKPNSEQGLMIVTRGAEHHVGKFVRRVSYFYNEKKSDDARWFIAAVVDRSGSQDYLTRELLEFSPADVDIVEESAGDRAAGNLLFESVRYAAKVGKPEVRRPGEGDLGHIYASISGGGVP